MRFENFTPTGDSVTVTATTTTGITAIGSSQNTNQILVYNAHTAIVFINLGGASVTAATATSMPIPPGGWVTINAQQFTHFALIAASTTGSVYVTPGFGT